MRQNDIRPPRRRRRAPRATDNRRSLGIAPNLLKRNFHADAPDRVRLADISYVPTDEGWLHLAAVKDMATMEIVGPRGLAAFDAAHRAVSSGQARTTPQGAMSDSLKKGPAIDAMRMALRNRRPPPGLACHSDRGVQYARGDYRKLLAAYGAKASMSGKGACLDNAPMESFFRSLKTEMVHRSHFHSRREAKAALFEHVASFYNRQRRHSRIGYRTPDHARIDMTRAQAA